MSTDALEWRLRRLSQMSAAEVGWRISDHLKQRRWASRQIAPGTPSASWATRSTDESEAPWDTGRDAVFRPFSSGELLQFLAGATRQSVIATADELLAGRWRQLGVERFDMVDPDWFFDPVTGRRAPQADYCFNVNHRSEEVTGNIKQVWELSRLHHVTVLGAAFSLTGDERYAERAASHLRSWWTQNTFLSGVHWTSGIEVGLRLIAWVWVRRLLDGWKGAAELFEGNDVAMAQIWWHQYYLSSYRSRGSSANNHVIAEAAGLLVASLAFDWFEESFRWAEQAALVLEKEMDNNTFPSGVNREMAFDYHGFVTELSVVAAVEADWAGRPLSPEYWAQLSRSFDVVAATVDVKLRAPRRGDGDNGAALVLDPPTGERWPGLLAVGQALFDKPGWWPKAAPTVTSTLLAAMANGHRVESPESRPNHFTDAGLTIMRSAPRDGVEIWCCCDAGPHGFLAIAAHAHADALAIEVRHGGTDVLADPGTYCYHGEPAWRTYFRSTLAHNTIEVVGRDQSSSGGPFLWTHHARSRLIDLKTEEEGEVVRWSAEHDGYRRLTPSLRHQRSVQLSSHLRRLEITDLLESAGTHPFRLPFHFGPDISAELIGHHVELSWPGETSVHRATLSLPPELAWSLWKGEEEPVLGWYSSCFGEKQPAGALIGQGSCSGAGSDTLLSVLQFHS